MKRHIVSVLVLVLCFCFWDVRSQTPVVFSNPGGPGTNGNNGSGTTVDVSPVSVPFDGYSCLLLLTVGVWYVGRSGRLKSIDLVLE